MLLTATELSKSHGMRTLFKGVSMSIAEGDRLALIGPNGAGKSTLLRMLAQREEPDAGSVRTPRGIVSVYVPQRDDFPDGQTAREAVAAAALACARCHGDEHEALVLASVVLGKIGFEEERMDVPLSTLSGGWRKRCSIAAGLARAGGTPDLLLLDEPTNHLDVEGLEWLERFLVKGAQDIRAGTSIFVTHDRVFLERVATREFGELFAPGDCVAVMGPNGSGKTTLLRTLVGERAPDAGSVGRADPAPRVVTLSQQRAELDGTMTLKDAICPVGDKVRFRGGEMHITAWSRRFLFDDDQLLQQVSRLSGGELARAHIARMMLEPADVLVLDEPTNDLDLPTLGVLEQSIEEFEGPVLLVTHDRAMLERLATQVIVLGGPDGASAQVADLDQALRALKGFEAAADAGHAPVKPAPAARDGATGSAQGSAESGVRSGAPQRKKLSYNDQREYDGIEAAIAKAEAAAAKADERMNDPALQTNHVAFRAACDASAAAHTEVARLYARWEELEAKLA